MPMIDLPVLQTVNRAKSVGIGNTCVGLGDSIMIGATTFNPDSIKSWYQFGAYQSNNRLRNVFNAGIGGNTTTQMLARIYTDVIAHNPANCLFMGGINDLAGSVPLSTITTNYESIVNILRQNGIRPMLCSVMPNNTAGLHAGIQQCNVYLSHMAQRYGIPYFDLHRHVVDPTNGNYLASMTLDGVHPNTDTAYGTLAAALSSYLDSIQPQGFPWLTPDQSTAPNVLTEGLFLTQATWSTTGNNANTTVTYPANTIGRVTDGQSTNPGNALQIVANTATQREVFQAPTLTAGLPPNVASAGDILAFSCRLATVGALAGSMSYQVQISYVTGSGATILLPLATTTNDFQYATGAEVYYEFPFPAGCLFFKVSFLVNSGSGTLLVAQPSLVDLTALGITQ